MAKFCQYTQFLVTAATNRRWDWWAGDFFRLPCAGLLGSAALCLRTRIQVRPLLHCCPHCCVGESFLPGLLSGEQFKKPCWPCGKGIKGASMCGVSGGMKQWCLALLPLMLRLHLTWVHTSTVKPSSGASFSLIIVFVLHIHLIQVLGFCFVFLAMSLPSPCLCLSWPQLGSGDIYYLAFVFSRLYPAVLWDLWEEFHGPEQCPTMCPLCWGQHCAVCPRTSQEGKRVLPQQLLWRCLPFPGTAVPYVEGPRRGME